MSYETNDLFNLAFAWPMMDISPGWFALFNCTCRISNLGFACQILKSAVSKLVVMLVMLSMTKHFLKMYVFLFAFIYLILFFNWDFFYILDILMHDIFGYSDFRVFPMAASHARICCLWQQSCQPCSAGPSRRVGKALAWVALVMLFSNSMTS